MQNGRLLIILCWTTCVQGDSSRLQHTEFSDHICGLTISGQAKRIKAPRVSLPGSKAVTPSERNSSPATSIRSVADDGATTDDARSNFDYGGYQDEEDSIPEKAALPTGAPAKPRHLDLRVS